MSRTHFLILVFLAALGLRLGAIAALRGFSAPPSPRHGADGVEFERLGWRLATDHRFAHPDQLPTSFRAPGLPFFLALIYGAVGREFWCAYLAFATMGAVACVLTYDLARWVVPEPTARAATVLVVVYIPHVLTATRFDSENLFVPILAGALCLFLRASGPHALGSILGAGVVLGLGALVRPFALLIVPTWGMILLTRPTAPPRRRLAIAAGFVLSFAVVVAPWTLRNWLVHGRPVLITTNGGSTFYGANNGRVANLGPHLGGWLSTTELPDRDRIDATPDEATHDRMEWKLGLAWVAQNPARLPLLEAGKLVRLWLPDIDSPNRPYVALQVVTYVPLLGVMAVGWASLLGRPEYRSASWLACRATLGATILTALIFWGSPRFRDVNAPILMIYAAVGLETIAGKWSDVSRNRAQQSG